MKKIKLELGQIWQKRGTLNVRTISLIKKANSFPPQYPSGTSYMNYFDIGGTKVMITMDSFRRWIRRNKVQLIGHYDFDKRKVGVVK